MSQIPTIDRLLNLVPDSPDTVLSLLQSHPNLAAHQDSHGYSLVHASASYSQGSLLRALVKDYNVDPNIKDEDGETALFSVEEVEMAKELLELGTDMTLKNNEGHTAAEKLDDEDEQPAVAAYLREAAHAPSTTETPSQQSAVPGLHLNGTPADIHSPPPPLPGGLQLNVGTMSAAEIGQAPDPEFRRRIEELASREDFQSEDGQRQLRQLISEAVTGLNQDGDDAPPTTRRRLE